MRLPIKQAEMVTMSKVVYEHRMEAAFDGGFISGQLAAAQMDRNRRHRNVARTIVFGLIAVAVAFAAGIHFSLIYLV